MEYARHQSSAKENRSGWRIKTLTNHCVLVVHLLLFQVRLAALKVLEGFHARLGEDFMVLLPETIPFLAELMEGEPHKLAKDFCLRRLYALTFFKTCYFFYVSDECFEVEEQCQHVISEIEQVLGEPLQKYF